MGLIQVPSLSTRFSSRELQKAKICFFAANPARSMKKEAFSFMVKFSGFATSVAAVILSIYMLISNWFPNAGNVLSYGPMPDFYIEMSLVLIIMAFFGLSAKRSSMDKAIDGIYGAFGIIIIILVTDNGTMLSFEWLLDVFLLIFSVIMSAVYAKKS